MIIFCGLTRRPELQLRRLGLRRGRTGADDGHGRPLLALRARSTRLALCHARNFSG
jgi:hypothetical protein